MLPWPASSRGLSAIEKVWGQIGLQLRLAASTVDLEGYLYQLWQDLSKEHIRRLYASMAFYIATCPRAKGLKSRSGQGHGGRAVNLLASHQGYPGSIPGRATPDFRMWELCWVMPMVGGLSWGSPLDVKSRRSLFTRSPDEGRGKREILEKTHKPAVSSGMFPTCDNLGTTPPGIEPSSPMWETSSLATTSPLHLTEMMVKYFFKRCFHCYKLVHRKCDYISIYICGKIIVSETGVLNNFMVTKHAKNLSATFPCMHEGDAEETCEHAPVHQDLLAPSGMNSENLATAFVLLPRLESRWGWNEVRMHQRRNARVGKLETPEKKTRHPAASSGMIPELQKSGNDPVGD
ncbi:hypothetical protein PR048_011870 [Dryococelus australis]|uniref:Uncharacterized protein n=1 Tax=Dryococelus australis TaxID=614101 RepID=A0ABQ9HMX0_9NEOP|nr:hypothetical protein PR048_011870 [Dryococelus australis]